MGFTQIEYSNLDRAFEFFNKTLFEGRLPDLLFTYQYRGKYYGRYREKFFAIRGVRTVHRIAEIALNPKVFVQCDDMEIFQTIAHEMVHHWQYTFGKPSRTGYHNKEFAWKMKSIGLMPSSTGKPGGAMLGQTMADYVIEGGRFEEAAIKLIKSGYVVKFEVPTTAMDIRIQKPQAQQSAQQGVPTAFVEYDDPDALPMVENAPMPHPNAKTTYMCPCKQTLWGKPALEVICKKCGGEFQAIRN